MIYIICIYPIVAMSFLTAGLVMRNKLKQDTTEQPTPAGKEDSKTRKTVSTVFLVIGIVMLAAIVVFAALFLLAIAYM